MASNTPPLERWTGRRFAELGAFFVVVALFHFVSAKAGMRGLGLMMLIGAALQLKDGRISYGWEGHEPSGYIAGTPAKLLSLVMALAGLAMLVWPLFLLELLGWEKL